MPGLSFLKKKRTREEQPAASSSKQQQHGDATQQAPQQQQQQQQQKQPSQGLSASGQTQAIDSGGAGSGVQSPHAAAPQQQQQQQQQAAPTSTTTATASSGANTNTNITNSSAGNIPPPSRDAQNLNTSGFNHLVQQPQHEGANQSNTSLNSPSPMSNAGAIAGPPIAPIPSASTSASPGTDPNALYQQQQVARPPPPLQAQPTPNTMQTDQPHQQQLQPQSQNAVVAAAAPQGHQPRVTKGKYSLTDFDILRTLGTGSFGRVHLVQSKHNQRFYAIKVLKKAQVVKMKQVEHTNDERRMLSDVKHPFLITLWGTFQDWKNLYMVMDFVEGGELFSLLRKSGVSELFVPILALLSHLRGSTTRRASIDDKTHANELMSVRELT
jgi:protein kinase A